MNCSQNDSETIHNNDEVLKLILTSELETNVLFIYDITNGVINYEIKDGWEVAWESEKLLSKNFNNQREELCRGAGLAFAKCVKKKVDHGICVTVYKDGYNDVAIQGVCPETYQITTSD